MLFQDPVHQVYHGVRPDENAVLGDTTGSVVNGANKRTQTAAGRKKSSTKQRRVAAPLTNTDFPVTGDSAPSGSLSGPTLILDPALNSDVPREPAPMQHYGSLVHKARMEPPATSASDVWWFIYALDKDTAPSDAEIPRLQSQSHYKTKPEQKEFLLMACRFCR